MADFTKTKFYSFRKSSIKTSGAYLSYVTPGKGKRGNLFIKFDKRADGGSFLVFCPGGRGGT